MAVQALEYPRLGLVGFLCKTLPTMYTAYWIAVNPTIIIWSNSVHVHRPNGFTIPLRPQGVLLVHDEYMDTLSCLIGTHILLVLICNANFTRSFASRG